MEEWNGEMKEDRDKDGRTLPLQQPPLSGRGEGPCLQPNSQIRRSLSYVLPVCGCKLGELQSFQASRHLTGTFSCQRIRRDVTDLDEDTNVFEFKSPGQRMTSVTVQFCTFVDDFDQ